MTDTVAQIAPTERPGTGVASGGDPAAASAFVALLAAFGVPPTQALPALPVGRAPNGGPLSPGGAAPRLPARPAAEPASIPFAPAMRTGLPDSFPAVQEGPASRPQPLPGTAVAPSPAAMAGPAAFEVPAGGPHPSLSTPDPRKPAVVAEDLGRAATEPPTRGLVPARRIAAPAPGPGAHALSAGPHPAAVAPAAAPAGPTPVDVPPATPASAGSGGVALSAPGVEPGTGEPGTGEMDSDGGVFPPGGTGAPRPPASVPAAEPAAAGQRPAPAAAPHVVLRPAEVPAMVVHALADGQRRLLVSLEPARLGQVRIAVEVAADGRVTVRMRAQKHEALERLQREADTFGRIFASHGLELGPGALSFDLLGDEPEDGSADETGAGPGAGPPRLRGAGFAALVEHLLDVRT